LERSDKLVFAESKAARAEQPERTQEQKDFDEDEALQRFGAKRQK